jgi:putative transposase
MDEQTVRKTYNYKLKPTPEQERQLAEVLWHCRKLYNVALEERITIWKQRGVTITAYQQLAELPNLKAASQDFAVIHGQETSIDLGLEAFATLADGTRSFNPGWYRKAERALKTAQRRVSSCKKESNRRKAVTLLAKAHQTVRRQRQDFHHKTARALVRENDTIYHENLQPAKMVRNHHLAKSLRDAGWGAFLIILTDKAAWAGRRVVAVHPASTAQTCGGSDVMVQQGMSVRWHSCPDCGTSLQRDHHAAKNSERLGQSRRGGVAVAALENRECVGL